MLQAGETRVRPTLKRTKFACVNCKAAKAACDSNRPCAWCVRHALQDSCVDAPRKTRTSKKICCDPTLHAKAVPLKQEYRGSYQLALAADFTPTTSIPVGPPLSPPTDLFAIEDLLAPNFDFGPTNPNNQPCTSCPLYHTCAKDAPQRLICATSASPPHSPLSQETDEEPDTPIATVTTTSPISLATHPEYSLQTPEMVKPDPVLSPPSPSLPSPVPQLTPPQLSPPQLTPSQITSPQQQIIPQFSTQSPLQQMLTAASAMVAVQPRNLQGCCSFSTSPHLPPLIDDICNCSSLVQREMSKIQASLETISALMQLQNGPLIPTATFRVPDTTIEDCNDEFAKALGYDSRDDLLSSTTVDSITISTQNMMRSQDGADYESKPTKPQVTSLLPEKWAPGFAKCASDLPKATLPIVNQLVFSTKRGDTRYFTVLIKPCGWFSYISLLKQHPQMVDGIAVCGE